ncbi:MAG: zf-HC2 domain-containing protein [Acidobacteria bacterium]|nr:zf-HC2 domain-containing protein [Acidobacteriota bacterium]
MHCDQVRALMSEFLDGELPTAMHRSVEEHIRQCPACTAELQAWQRTNHLVMVHLPTLEPSSALWLGISRRIARERPLSLGERLWRQWRFALAAGVAAVVVLALLGVFFWSSPTAGNPEAMIRAQMEQYLKDRGHPHRPDNPFSEDEPAVSEAYENPFSRYIRLEYQNPFEEME